MIGSRLLEKACVPADESSLCCMITKITAIGMKNVLIFQEMIDFNAPESFEHKEITFLYMLSNKQDIE